MKKADWIHTAVFAAIILFLAASCKKEEPEKLLMKSMTGVDGNTQVKSVTDIDGNTYNTVTIGSQCWMAENLKTTKYRNGDLIGTTSPAALDIGAEATPKYQWAYDGEEKNVDNYGRLYTWYAITDPRDVCPTEWHLPTDAEWNTLTTFLGSICVAGGKLKEDNCFKALPGGWRYLDGSFSEVEISGQWWSSSEHDTDNAWYRYVRWDRAWGYNWNNLIGISFQGIKRDGFSVRCIKDNDNPSIPTFSAWEAPGVSTTYATNISKNGATLNGTVNANGLSTTVIFEYQYAKGWEWQEVSQTVTADQSPLTGNTETAVSAALTDLKDGTYIFRVKAENSFGISYGDDKTINSAHIPILTASVSGITDTTAILEGNITEDECAAVTMRGFFWTSFPNALSPSNHSGRGFFGTLNGSGTGSYTHFLTGLKPLTTYWVQPYARNSKGRTRGNIISFRTLSSGK